jgi:CBS domain-containing protein
MQRRPPVTTPDATLRSAARQMASEHTGLLPVIAGPEPEMARRVRGEPH